jgi:hypothetical protein
VLHFERAGRTQAVIHRMRQGALGTPEIVSPGHPYGATLPHPASPVQHQPKARDTVRRFAVGRSGAAVARWGAAQTVGKASPLAGALRRAGSIKGCRSMYRTL